MHLILVWVFLLFVLSFVLVLTWRRWKAGSNLRVWISVERLLSSVQVVSEFDNSSNPSLDTKRDVASSSDLESSSIPCSSVAVSTVSQTETAVQDFDHSMPFPCDGFDQFPLIPDASQSSTSIIPARRARKKSSHAPLLVHTVPATCDSLLEIIHEDPAATESTVRLDGLTGSEEVVKNSQMDLMITRVEQELMAAGHGAACTSDQNSLVDAGIMCVSDAQELMDASHKAVCGTDSISLRPPEDVIVIHHALVQDGASKVMNQASLSLVLIFSRKQKDESGH